MQSLSAPPAIPGAAREVLDDFRREYGGDVRVWTRSDAGWALDGAREAGGDAEPGAGALQVGETGIWLDVPRASPDEARTAVRFLASVLARSLRHDDEIRAFSREIAERYEEITLLYSISEILGSIISLEEASETILAEVSGILGARRAALWVCDADDDMLHLAAAVGGDGHRGPIPVDDRCSVTAEVFREGRPVILAPGEAFPRDDCSDPSTQQGSFLSVPVSYTPPEGETRPVGVINLVGRNSGGGFSAGDMKLLSAIASQIGAAVENNRLIADSLKQERVMREMELAHDLQLKLLPPLEQFAGYCEVAARCVPAESVGGDFYHLFRLPGGRLGVMIGDVSSHGFGAALIMALTMSAVAIHASEGDMPAEVLRRTHRALIDELETTEMYLTLFYAVIDPAEGRITYANAGHAHAFRITPAGEAQRLPVTDPPFGIVDRDEYHEHTSEWMAGRDLLFLFTDGLSDALEAGEIAGERILLDEIVAARDQRPDEMIGRLFSRAAGEPGSIPADDRTAVLVRF
ncbi:MAG TPA: SpoIIE family protein phosphatase [Longimicrobiaceae bacterium]|jgi:sigma-B regulation protein RsbU (phosphoserine phosphatase)|nr:SpoIIE family protein phosphatase [Longimicrobiaceae bacterium]